MYKHIKPILYLLLFFLSFFLIQKPVFVLYHYDIYSTLDISTLLSIIKAGFPLDLALSCYLIALPLLASLFSVYIQHKHILTFLRGYLLLISILLPTLFIVDLQLFSYWGFRLDTTPIFYFLSSPSSALASVTLKEYILGGITLSLLSWGLYLLMRKLILKQSYWLSPIQAKLSTTLVLILLCGLTFLGIRGGWTVSTMNVSRAYFSTDDKLNQAAVNPLFNLIESASREKDFSKQFQYYSEEQAQLLVDELYQRSNTRKEYPQLIQQKRPNIYIIILESFSIPLMNSKIEGEEITPYLNTLAKESIFFSQFYANSFRTDRGLISILSGYPAQPSTSIMKYPRKAQKLPSIPQSLKNVGYKLSYYYGGDINFTNMNAYLKSAGFEHILSDKDFPITQKLSKWGVHDHFVLERALSEINTDNQIPTLSVIQTSSSHEPFEVPFEKFKLNKANAFAYTDKCIGQFIEGLKQAGEWENSLVILLPDHQGAYPENLNNASIDRYHIPLIWTGGAIQDTLNVNTIGSQIDLPATLLEQLDIPTTEFVYSNNILDGNASHFGYFAFPNYIGLWNTQKGSVLNLQTEEVTPIGHTSPFNLSYAKALLQTIYLDMAKK